MKKLLLTVTLCLACAAAFAQGKVRLVNDSLHLVYFDPGSNGGTNSGGAYLVGQGGQNLTIELWAGTSSLTLGLVGTTSFAGQASPGTWAGMNVILPTGFPAGTAAFFAIDIYDVAASSYLLASTTPGHFYGTSGIFTAIPGTTAYNALYNHNPAPNAASTWADGTYNMDTILPGARGAIMLTQVPEPTTIVLAGLAGAGLMIMRRRK